MSPPDAGKASASPARLYTPRLLSLCAGLASFPFSGTFDHTAEARSRTCGSTIAIGLDLDADGKVARLGMQVTACAVGQSSAAIMAQSARGRSGQEFADTLVRIENWLAGQGPLPQWPDFDALEAAHSHSGRHGALIMPWKAVTQALSSASPSG